MYCITVDVNAIKLISIVYDFLYNVNFYVGVYIIGMVYNA